MDKKYNDLANRPAIDDAVELATNLLEQGVSVPDISFALVSVATDLGLQLAPSAAHAIAVVADAIQKTAVAHAFASPRAESPDEAETSGEEASSINAEIFGQTVH